MLKDLAELKSGKYGDFIENEAMKNQTTFKVGGPCDLLMRPKDEKEIRDIVLYCKENDIPLTLLGNGSNVLVRDKGIRGVVIKFDKNFNEISIDGEYLTAQAGALLSTASKTSFAESLEGMEGLSGIPGSVGGAIYMNAGAYGTEIKDVAYSVRCMDLDGNIHEFNNEEMDFGYRHSTVSEKDLICLTATFKLKKGNYEEIMARFKDFDYKRTSKQPLEKHSAGSTFKRPEGYFASKLIDDAGLRGYTYKRAQVSEKHCGFLINMDDATFDEVMGLITRVQDIVKEKFGVTLETEVKIIGEE